MKFALAILLPLLTTATASAAGIDPYRFIGTYTLTRDRLGLCESQVRGFVHESSIRGVVNVDVGPYFFPRVNGGRDVYDNAIDKGTTQSYTTADGRLVFEKRFYHKIRRANESITQVAHLRGDRLTLTHRYRGFAPTDVECHYRRVSNLNDDQ